MNQEKKIPRHVAIIMDGNGRWAEMQGKDRSYGHMQGVEPVRAVVRAAIRNGVKYLTLYAFSTENWGRPASEVNTLMELFCKCVVDETPELCKQGVQVKVIGNTDMFTQHVREHLDHVVQATQDGTKLVLVLALNYSSRNEIVRAVRKIICGVETKRIAPTHIDEETVGEALDTWFLPDPDLIVRTSGEQRLSNFLLWQGAYAELYFPEVLWPDFTEQEFDKAIAEYMRRDRRFGLVK